MSSHHESIIDKLRTQAASERALGNIAMADTYEAKAEKLLKQHAPKELTPQPRVVNSPPSDFSNFPGVKKADAPLSNEQLAALRTFSQTLGRPLSDAERCRVLGQDYTEPARPANQGENIAFI
jgi:hypothetical protein